MVLKIFKTTFTILAIVCYIAIFGLLSILAPAVFGYTPVVVLTGSMEPSIKTGSIVYNYKVDSFDKISSGDVVTFKTSEDSPLITHRVMIVDKEKQIFRTKGDNNTVLDVAPVPYQNIVAKVAPFYLPKVGFYISYAQDPKVIGIVAGIIVLNIILGYFGNREQDDESEEESEQAA